MRVQSVHSVGSFHVSTRASTHLPCTVWISYELDDRACQIVQIVFGNQKASAAMLHDFGHASHARGDYRQARGHGFQQNVGRSFVFRREHKDSCLLIGGRHVCNASGESEGVGAKVEGRGLPLQFGRRSWSERLARRSSPGRRVRSCGEVDG